MIHSAAEAILLRRRGHAACCALPDLTEAQAYAVQAQVATALSETVGGWKLAMVAGRSVAAPMLRTSFLQSGAIALLPPIVDTKIEMELGFTLAHDIPSGPIGRAQILAAIETVHAVFELVGARFGEPPAVKFTGFLADNLGNAAVVLGPGKRLDAGVALPEFGWLDRDGVRLAQGRHPHGDPLAALLSHAADQRDALGGLKKGQVIITGSFTGATWVDGPALWTGGFDGLDTVKIDIAMTGSR